MWAEKLQDFAGDVSRETARFARDVDRETNGIVKGVAQFGVVATGAITVVNATSGSERP
ncbi:MAG: hypothetical protein LBI80_04430 [Endomicrobium sp.]|nr:hypothetical protein [Endomicrobium sp.]